MSIGAMKDDASLATHHQGVLMTAVINALDAASKRLDALNERLSDLEASIEPSKL